MPLRSNSAYYTEESVFVKVDSSISVLDIDIGVRQKNAMTLLYAKIGIREMKIV